MLDLELTETCQSGLMYLFAKEAGFNRPRWSESSRLRKLKKRQKRYFNLRRRASNLNCLRAGFGALIPYLRKIHILSKWERGTETVSFEKCTHGPAFSLCQA